MNTEATLFQSLSAASDIVAPMLPGAAGAVAVFLGRAFALGADFVAAGRDPAAELTRIRERAPMLAEVDRRWEEQLRQKFGGPVEGRVDIYED